MGQDVDASCLGDEWKGYTLRITGGNDKQGFPMKQGVLTQVRTNAGVSTNGIVEPEIIVVSSFAGPRPTSALQGSLLLPPA